LSKKILFGIIFFIFSLSMYYSCQGNSEILKKTGSWRFEPPLDVVVEFYYIKEDVPENSLKDKAIQICRELLKSYSKAEIYIFYDKELAKKVASNKFKEEVAKGAVGLGEQIFWDIEAKVRGGALLQMSKEKPEEEWHFIERMELD
jgi:hypothetical protein